jgi:hypothetical protein
MLPDDVEMMQNVTVALAKAMHLLSASAGK